MTTTQVATTTRPVCFILKGDRTNRTLVTGGRTFPAGTEVYAMERRDGTFNVRIPGTLFKQTVYAGTLDPA